MPTLKELAEATVAQQNNTARASTARANTGATQARGANAASVTLKDLAENTANLRIATALPTARTVAIPGTAGRSANPALAGSNFNYDKNGVFATTKERDDLITQLRKLQKQETGDVMWGGSFDTTNQINDIIKRINDIDKILGNPETDYSDIAAIGNTLSGGAKGWIGDQASYFGTTAEGLSELGRKLGGNTSDYAGWIDSDVAAANIGMENDPAKYEQQLAETRAIQNWGRNVSEDGAVDIAQAQSNRGVVGRTAVELGANLTQQLLDRATTVATGGAGALIPLYTRAAGSAMREAEDEGASLGQRLLYGNAVGGVEAATEKMFEGLPIYGKGTIDDVVDTAIRRITKGGAAAIPAMMLKDAAGEGLEELISDVANPALKTIYNGKNLKESYKENFSLKDAAHDVAIGALMGGLGAGTKVVTGDYKKTAQKMRTTNEVESQLQESWGTDKAGKQAAGEYADLIAKAVHEGDLSPKEIAQIESKPTAMEALNNVASNMVNNAFKNSGLTDAQLNVLKDGIELSPKLSTEDAVTETKIAFEQGKAGKISVEDAIEQSKLDPTAAEHAYMLGQAQSAAQTVGQRRVGTVTAGEAVFNMGATMQSPDGKTEARYKAANLNNLSPIQQRTVDMANAVADALPVDIVLFDDKAGPLGAYTQNGKIYLNIGRTLAKGNGVTQSITAATLSHELTHYIQDFATEEYDALKDFVAYNILETNEQEFDDLIEQQIRIAANSGQEMTREEAFNEVVANACQSMLFDSEAINKLASENMNLAERVLDSIEQMISNIQEAFADVDINDENMDIFRAVRAVQDQLKDMQKLWDEGIEAASKNNVAQEATNEFEPGQVQYMSFASAKQDGFETLINRYYSGNLSRNDPVYIGPATGSGQRLLKSNLPLIITGADLNKSTRSVANNKNYSAHGMGENFIRSLPDHVNNAAIAYKVKGENGDKFTYVVFDEDTGKLVSIGGNHNEIYEGNNVDRIKSIYPIGSPVEFLTKSDKELVFESKEKAKNLLQRARIQTPGLQRILDYGKTITEIEEDVNNDYQAQDWSDGEIYNGRATVQFQDFDGVEDAAVEHFGTTDDFKVAGYITPDGRVLDFSGAHWLDGYDEAYVRDWKRKNDLRQADHEDIYEAFEAITENPPSDSALSFIQRGNIRVVPELPGIELYAKKEPTPEQYAQIRDYIDAINNNPGKFPGERFVIDYTENRRKQRSQMYSGELKADRIINDIKNYYRTGEVRDQGLSAFYQDVDEQMEFEDVTQSGQNPEFRSKNAAAKALMNDVKDFFRTVDPDSDEWLSEDDIDRMMEFDPYSSSPDSSSMFEPDGIVDRLSEISKDLSGEQRQYVYDLMERLLKYGSASWQQIYVADRSEYTDVGSWLEPRNPEFAKWYNKRHPSLYYPGYKPGDLFVENQPKSRYAGYMKKEAIELPSAMRVRRRMALDNIQTEKDYLHSLLERKGIAADTRAEAQAFLNRLNSYDPNDREIFYQDVDDAYDDTLEEARGREKSYARLEAENAILNDALQSLQKLTSKQENTIAKLQQRLHLTKDPEVRESDAKRLAKQLLTANDSKANAAEIATDLKAIGDYILNGSVDPEELKTRARNVASKIIEAAEVTETADETIAEIKNRIKGTKFKISADEAGDIEGYENLNEFRKKNMGRFSIVANNSKGVTAEHQAVDSFYEELREAYGDHYFPELTNQGEMMKVISDFFTAGEGLTVNPFSQFMGEATEALANDIISDALNGIMRPAQTDADRWKSRREGLNAQIKELKAQGALQDKEAARLWQTIYDLSVALDKASSKYKTLQAEAEYRAEQIKSQGIDKVLREKARSAERIDALKNYYEDMRQRERLRRSKTKVRQDIRKMINDLNTRLARPSENKHVPKDLVMQTIDILQMIDYDSGRGGEKFAERIAKIRNMYDSYQKNEAYAVAYDEVTAEMLKNLAIEVDGKNLYDMDENQLDTVYKTLKSMIHVIDNAVKIRIGNEERNAFDVSRQMTGETRDIGKKQKGWLRQHYLPAHLRADVAFRRFGGWKKNSAWEAASRMLNDGQLKQTDIHMKLSKPFSGLINNEKAMRDFFGANFFGGIDEGKLVDIGLKDENGDAIKVTHDIMVGIYMDLMNEDNKRHFIHTGKTIPNLKDFYSGKGGFDFGARRAVGISTELSELNHQLREAKENGDEDLMEELKSKIEDVKFGGESYADTVLKNIEANLTEFDKSWIQMAQQLMDVESKRYLNQTTMDVYGIEKATTPNYWPITTDKNFLNTPFESITKDASLENVGFMKERVKSGNPTLALGTAQVVNNQINRVAQYSGLMPAIRNFNKIWNKVGYGYSDSLKNALNGTFGKEGTQYVENLLADLTGSRTRGDDTLGVGTLLGRLRGNLAQTTLTGNLRVAMSQAASYPTAAAELGAKPLAKAFAHGGKDGRVISRADQELIEKYSPLLYHRMQGYSTVELGDIKDSQRLSSRVWKKMKWFTGWIQAVDGATIGRLWSASEYWVQDNMPDLRKGTDEYYQEVAKKFNDVVEKTQPNYTTMQRAAILRDPNELVKSLTMFMTQRLQNFNVLYDAAGGYQKARADFANNRNGVTKGDVTEAKTQLTRAIGSQVAQAATFVGFKLLADAIMHNMKPYRDDEDGELTKESIGLKLLDNFVDAVTGTMIGGSEVTSIIRALTGDSKWYGLSLSGVDSVNDLVNNIMTLATTKYDRNTEKGRAAWNRQVTKIAQSLCQFVGLPASNAVKIKDAIVNHIEDIASGEFLSFNAGYEQTNDQQAAAAIKALQSGDKEAIQKVVEGYGSQKDMLSAVKGAVKQQFLGGKIDSKGAASILKAAGDRDKDIDSTVKKWEFQQKYGFAYSELRQQYLDGNISRADAISSMVKYGGKSAPDVNKIMADYDFAMKHEDEYGQYGLSVSQARPWYEKYKGRVTLEKYADQIDQYGTEAVKDYYDQWQPATGMSIDDYSEYKAAAPLYGDDKKIGAYNAWKENLKGTMTMEKYLSILRSADLDINGSLKQDELGAQLLQAIEKGEMTYEQAYKIWHSQGWTTEFDAWAKKKRK